MKYLNLIVCLLALSVSAGELKKGAMIPMPDAKLKNVDGKMISINDIKGSKGTVVAFWCNHCPYVKKNRERFNKLANTYMGRGIGFIAINSNDPKSYPDDSFEAMKKSVAMNNYKFPYVVDEGSKLAKAFGATRTPHIFVFNAKSELVYVGAIDDSPADPSKVTKHYLKDWLSALVKDSEATVSNTRAFGCSIKWYK